MTTAGEAMRDARTRARMTQLDIERATGQDRGIWSRRETGAMGVTEEALQALATATGQTLICDPVKGWQVGEQAPTTALRFRGRVPCGHPILFDQPAAEEVTLVDLTHGAWRDDRHFLVQAEGDSMIGVGIRDEDFLIIDHRREPELRDVVLAVLNEQTTVKFLTVCPDSGDWVLAPANPNYEPRQVTEYDELAVQGVVVGLIRWTPLVARWR